MEVFVPENTMQPNVDPRLSLSFVSALWLGSLSNDDDDAEDDA